MVSFAGPPVSRSRNAPVPPLRVDGIAASLSADSNPVTSFGPRSTVISTIVPEQVIFDAAPVTATDEQVPPPPGWVDRNSLSLVDPDPVPGSVTAVLPATSGSGAIVISSFIGVVTDVLGKTSSRLPPVTSTVRTWRLASADGAPIASSATASANAFAVALGPKVPGFLPMQSPLVSLWRH